MTSLDTNILVTLWNPNAQASQSVVAALQRTSSAGPLCICGPVYSELMGQPGRDSAGLKKLLESMGISLECAFGEADWESAGLAYQDYVRRRRKSGDGLPRRMLTDFLIGAHASVRGYTLLTLDKRTYAVAFPTLHIESF